MTSRRPLLIELPVGADWEAVDTLRTAVLSCVRTIFGNDGWADLIGMVARELLENAVKYGDWKADRKDPGCKLRVKGDAARVEIAVTNPVDLGDPGLGRLFEELHRIQSAPSTEYAYACRMIAIAESPDATSGLGLVRIAHEAGCLLDATTTEPGILEVRAIWRRVPAFG